MYKCTVEKSQTNATSIIMHHLLPDAVEDRLHHGLYPMLTTRGYFIRLVREFPSKKVKVKVKERLVNWAYEVKLCIPYPQKSHWADRPLESETF